MLQSLVKKFRKVMGLFREKATVRLDDHEFEHLLLYHGLVGSSPENQRDFKDVRADVLDAIKASSALQLGIALKLQPLHWQDKLEKIFSEVTVQNREKAANAFLPDTGGAPWPNISDPLGHDDWRVRANAAFGIASLKLTEGVDRLVKALHDTASSASPAYCHVALALGKLQNEESKQALMQHLYDPEAWFRVDTAAALAQYPAADVKQALITSLLTINPLSDYLAVTLSKHFSVLESLQDDSDEVRKGGLQLLIGLVDAAGQTFTADVLYETDLSACAQRILELSNNNLDVFVLKAAEGLGSIWRLKPDDITISADSNEMNEYVRRLDAMLHQEQSSAEIQRVLEHYEQKSAASTDIELLNAVKLAGALKLQTASKSLVNLLKVDSPLRDEIVAAAGAIGEPSTADTLVRLAQELYKTGARNTQSLSGQPVEEDDNAKAKLYWRILQALGNIPGSASAQFLLTATGDFAPDKRQQALDSLRNICSSMSKEENQQFTEIVTSSLDDPSTPVRVSSLKGVSALNAVQQLDKVLKMSDSQEPSISRQALATLRQLSRSHDKKVVDAIKEKISKETDSRRKQRLEELLKN